MSDESGSLRTNKEPMPAETLEALRGSIKKWQKVMVGKMDGLGGEDCPLCLRFNRHFNEEAGRLCAGCPISAATGKPFCESTPFDRYQDFLGDDADDDYRHPGALQIAKEELDFLISLLPEGEAP